VPISSKKSLTALTIGIVVGMISLIASLGVVELGIRLVEPMLTTKPWSTRPRYYFTPESAATLQGFTHKRKKPENTFRIAIVGDSYSFAPYMQFTDTFPKVLERMLNLNATDKKVEVVNYGIPALSTNHEIDVLKRALKEQADLVILQITLNDAELKPYAPIGIQATSDRFGQLQKSDGWLSSIAEHLHSLRFVMQRLHNQRTRREYVDYFNNLFTHPKGWKVFSDAVGTIGGRCKKKNIPVVSVVFPLFGLPLDGNYPFMQTHEKILTLLKEKSIPAKDLYSLYAGIPLDQLQVIPGVDRHPNEIAHRMAAEALYDWLAELKLLPKENLIKKAYKGRTKIIKEEEYRW
jgi:hypothetical protein